MGRSHYVPALMAAGLLFGAGQAWAQGAAPPATPPAATPPAAATPAAATPAAPAAGTAASAAPTTAPPPGAVPDPNAPPGAAAGTAGAPADPNAPPAGEPPPKPPCVLGEFCFGPVLTLGLINPLGIGLHTRYTKLFGFNLDYQFMPSLSIGGASAGFSMLSLDARIHPFKSGFFLALGFGLQNFSAEASSAGATVKGSANIPGLKLGLGFAGHHGFVVGIDLGLLVPLGSKSLDITTSGLAAGNAGEVANLTNDVKDAGDKVLDAIPLIPQLNLLRIGYLF